MSEGISLDEAARRSPRWQGLKIERLAHPLDALHQVHALPQRVAAAERIVRDSIERIGPAEAMWVAEQIAFEYGVAWWEGRLIISLSDLQLIAFAAALRAHHEALYPQKADKK